MVFGTCVGIEFRDVGRVGFQGRGRVSGRIGVEVRFRDRIGIRVGIGIRFQDMGRVQVSGLGSGLRSGFWTYVWVDFWDKIEIRFWDVDQGQVWVLRSGSGFGTIVGFQNQGRV